MKRIKRVMLPLMVACCMLMTAAQLKAQYVQKERDDTIRLWPKGTFDTVAARYALQEGNGTIKGVAFTRPNKTIYGRTGKRIYANKIKVVLFPVTPYLLEYLDLRKKQNPKKLKFVYLSPDAYRFRLEAVTNSTGEFTFPKMKPGKYYIQGVLGWYSSGYYDRYTGSGYNGYGTTNYYSRELYTTDHSDLLEKFVDVDNDGQVVEVKLK